MASDLSDSDWDLYDSDLDSESSDPYDCSDFTDGDFVEDSDDECECDYISYRTGCCVDCGIQHLDPYEDEDILTPCMQCFCLSFHCTFTSSCSTYTPLGCEFDSDDPVYAWCLDCGVQRPSPVVSSWDPLF